jgi:hypothetical protein
MIHYRREMFERITAIHPMLKPPFWAQSMTVTNINGAKFSIVRHDRDFWEVCSPLYSAPIQVKGWMDGLRLINCT